MDGCKGGAEKNLDWVSELLQCSFFSSCDHHQDLGKNEKNLFCIDCSIAICKYCAKNHRLHRTIKICKYVYQDVGRLQELQNYINCSKIQTYKINGEQAVHLNPRPQLRVTKPSKKARSGAACEACHRYLQDQQNRFCSIACKISILSVEAIDLSHELIPFPPVEGPDQALTKETSSSQERDSTENESPSTITDVSEETTDEQQPKKSFRLRKRKRTPTRSPLF